MDGKRKRRERKKEKREKVKKKFFIIKKIKKKYNFFFYDIFQQKKSDQSVLCFVVNHTSPRLYLYYLLLKYILRGIKKYIYICITHHFKNKQKQQLYTKK